MLKVFRENLKKLAWVLWAVIAVFILLVFVDFGSVSQPGTPRGAAASVGDREVSWASFQNRYQAMERQYRDLYGDQFNADMARQLQIPRNTIEQLINDQVLLVEARKTGLTVTDEEVRQAILDIPGLVDAQGRFVGEEIYERFARNNNYSGPAELERAIRDNLLRRKLFDVVSQTVHVSDAEIEQAYRDEVERARVRFLQVPAARFGGEVEVDDEALQRYYEQHQSRFQLPEQREVDYLLVDKALLRAQLEISEDELRAYFESNPDEFSREEQVRARHILLRTDERSEGEAVAELERIAERIEGGEDFAAIAREVSEDPGSGARGGDLGFFGRGRMTPEFEEVAFTAETGEVFGPVTTPFGVHLVEVTDRREEGKTPFEEARSNIRSRIAAQRVDDEALEVATDLRRRLADAQEGELHEIMQSLAEEHPAVRFATTPPFGRSELVSGLGRAPVFTQTVFALEQGELAEGTVDSPRGPTIVRLAEVVPPRTQTLAEAEPQVRRAVEQERQQEIALQRLQGVKEAVQGGMGLEEAASDLGVEIQESEEFGAQDPIQGLGFDPAINEAVLAAGEGEVVGPLESGQGAVLLEVTERRGFDAAELAARRDEIRQRLEEERANQLLTSIIQSRRQEMGVSYDPALVEEFDLGAG